MIFTVFYYIFFSSAVFLYGVGLNSATIICDSVHKLTVPVIKILVNILGTASISWLLLKFFLIPLNLTELYPLVSILIFLIISVLVETLIRITTGRVASEFSVTYLIVLLALNESLNIIDVILITSSCLVSFIVLIPVLYSIKKRIDIVGNMQVHGNRKSLILISLAIIATILAVGNVSWLNPRILP